MTSLLNSKLNETKMEVLLSLYAAHLRNIIGLLSRPNVWVLIVDVPGKEWNYRSVSGPYLYWHLCSLYGSSCQPVGLGTEDCSPTLTSLYTSSTFSILTSTCAFTCLRNLLSKDTITTNLFTKHPWTLAWVLQSKMSRIQLAIVKFSNVQTIFWCDPKRPWKSVFEVSQPV